MKVRTYLLLSGTIFGVVALAHLLRILNGWPIEIGGWTISMPVSWLALGLTAVLAVSAFRLVNH